MSKDKKDKDKKHPIELTNDEVMDRLFPKEVIDEAKRVAHEKDAKKEENGE